MSPLAPRTQRLTVVLLAASLVLGLPGVVGVGPSLGLAVILAVLAGVLLSVRNRLVSSGRTAGIDLGRYAQDLWVGPAIGVAIVLLLPGATPGELQAVGGVCGLLGMANYFLRPVYASAIALGRYVQRAI